VELQQSINGGTSYTAVSSVALTSSSTGTILTGLAAGTYLYRLRLVFAGTEVFSNIASATVGGSYSKNASENVNTLDYMPDYLYVGCYDNTLDDAALKFDLSDCAGTVKNAYLYIYVSEYPDLSYGNAHFDLYGHTDDTWTIALPSYPSVPTNSTLIQSDITDLALGEYKQLTVTDFVKSQFSANDKTLTFYLAGLLTSDMAQDDICIASVGHTTYKPYIVIEFANTNANLSGIKIGGTDLAGFSAATTSYSYTAPHNSDVSVLELTSTLEDSSAVQGAWAYNSTNHTWSVMVTAPDGTTTKTYTVSVAAALESSDASLTSISIGGTPITGFSSSTLNYDYTVAHDTDASAFTMTSVANDHMAVQGGWLYNSVTKKWSNIVTSEDGTIQTTYTVTINELPDIDATLKSIKVNGTDITGFSSSTYAYTCDVVHGTIISAASFVSATTDVNATQGTWTYSAVTGKWSVLVTAEDGTTQETYTVTIHELPDTDATLKSIQIDTIDLSGFSASTFAYTYDVVHGVDGSTLDLSSATTDVNATQGTWTYDAGTLTWSVLVTAEDGITQETYTVTVNVLPDIDATLKSIKVNGTDISGFASSTFAYTYDVVHGFDGSTLSLSSETTDVLATQGTWSYDAGTSTWSVYVTAEDGTTQEVYTVTINELPDIDATLKSIKVNGTDITGFSSSTYAYTCDVVHGTLVTAASFVSATTDVNATQGTWTYSAVTGKWSVLVTAEDGTTQETYTVTINELPDTDATLKSIHIDKIDLSGFSSSTFAYTYDVVHGVDGSTLDLSSETTDVNATQGTWTYDAGTLTWSVLVTAEDGITQETYTVTVNVLPDIDATLKSIKVNGTDIAGFSPSTFAYTYDVVHGFDGSTLVLSSETTDVNAFQGDWTYDAGTLTWSVTVTAEDGTTQEVYTVTVNELRDTDATLSSISVAGTDITGFSSSTYAYTCDVVHGTLITAASFVSVTTDVNATQGTWTYNFVTGKWSELVTAEDGTTQETYTVTINELPDTDATLKSIRIDTIDLGGFSSSTLAYTYDVVHGFDGSTLALTSETTDVNANQGTWTYSAVTGKWSVLVTAEDGTTLNTYTVTINELPDTDATLKSIKVNGTDITGFSPATMDYTVDAVHGTAFTSLSFVSETTDVNALQGTWTYDAVKENWFLKVTAEDGTTQKTYTVTINELPDTDATLSSIQIDTIEISGFVSSTFAYTYDVVHGSNGSLLMFTSATTDVNADQGTWTYDAVNDSWSVLVTAEDGTTQETYTVTINVLPDTDATLKSIKVNGTDIAGFSPATQHYTIDVAHGAVITSASFVSETTDVNAVQETWTYSAGKGIWFVLVTAEDGTTENYYSVTINELPDTDATLKSIKVNDADIDGFSPATLAYTVDVVHGTIITSASFASATTDVNAIQGTWTYNAVTGKWNVLVTAEDGTTQKTYTITINELPNIDATLKSIKVNGTDLSGFTPLTLNYSYTAPKGSDLAALVFTSACSDANAAQSAWTYDSLNHKWSVTVTAQDTTVLKTYSVTVVEDLGKGDYKTNTLLYQSHVQDIGWMDAVMNGNISGTTAQSKRMEAIKIKLQDIAGGIEYCTHIQDIGWTGWSADGDMSGTTAQSKRLEAIQIRLTGEAADKYDIYYRVHVQDIGWMDWAKNGQSAGTAACSYRMESIQIVMVLKGDSAPGSTEKAFYNGHTGRYNEQ
jgi:hypothetical protein